MLTCELCKQDFPYQSAYDDHICIPPLGRAFDSGAYRDTDEGKLDYEGFLSPIVIERYAQYLNANRKQSNGDMRDSDNWQQGIPRNVYMKSAWRHFMDCWKAHRGYDLSYPLEEALCAVLFNISGYLHELLLKRDLGKEKEKQNVKT